jgi:Uri superfamily endonuclease
MNMDYIDKLISNCGKAKESKPIQEFVMQNLSQLKDIKTAIYIIEEIEGNAQQTFIDFSIFKKSKIRACAKLNSPSKIMYVGSSTTGLEKRIEQHMGDGAATTYALHLKHWFKGKYQITIRQYNETPEVLQIIEDALSSQLQPAFGKKGGNNK